MTDEIEIVIDLVTGWPAIILPVTAGQHPAAAIAALAYPDRYAGQPGNQGGIERVREDDGRVEGLSSQFGGQSESAGNTLVGAVAVEHHDPVDPCVSGEELPNQRIGQHGDLC